VDLIRFGLLLTMTVALISVATRYDDHASGRNTAARGHQPASASPSPAGGQAESPSQGGSTPSQSGSTPLQRGSTPGHGHSQAGAPNENGGGGGEVAVPTLPRTGGTQAVELAALAALFIAAGSFGMRISRPRAATVQAAGPPTAATQAGQARGSSESNRPGTV
jgi:hypothetical protein